MTVCFLSWVIELFGLHCESLTPTQKFWISPWVSYTHTEILDISTGLLHPHRNSGYLHEPVTPTQKFWISPRVSYTHTEILDISMSLLHPLRNSKILDISTGLLHSLRNSGYLLHPYKTFRILPWVSFTQIPGFSPEGINDPLLAFPNTH